MTPSSDRAPVDGLERWTAALLARHGASLSRTELLKAIRALSARYVERRGSLPTRSPLDSAGKRAAFAAYYTPLHALTVHAVLTALGPAAPRTIVDLGCGTGAAAIAWALTRPEPPAIVGVDVNRWALDEMRWNCRHLGLRCSARAMSVTTFVDDLARTRRSLAGTALVAGWSLNELTDDDRSRLRPGLLALHERGAPLLVVEPLARRAVPWWDSWQSPILSLGGRADEWKLPLRLPAALSDLDAEAGFRRDALGARTLWLAAPPAGGPRPAQIG